MVASFFSRKKKASGGPVDPQSNDVTAGPVDDEATVPSSGEPTFPAANSSTAPTVPPASTSSTGSLVEDPPRASADTANVSSVNDSATSGATAHESFTPTLRAADHGSFATEQGTSSADSGEPGLGASVPNEHDANTIAPAQTPETRTETTPDTAAQAESGLTEPALDGALHTDTQHATPPLPSPARPTTAPTTPPSTPSGTLPSVPPSLATSTSEPPSLPTHKPHTPMPTHTTPAQRFAHAIDQWKSDLVALTTDRGSENLPRYTLGNAHPGGLAQLYAQHPTRLSNLVREPGAYQRTLSAARRIMARQAGLAAQHGLAPTHLAMGYASWVVDGIKHTSPALLRPITLHEDGNEVILTLGSQLLIAPGLAAAASNYGVTLTEDDLHKEAGADAANFSPTRALTFLRGACHALPGFELRDDLAMGIYDHPAARLLRELDDTTHLAASPIVRALAGDDEAIALTTAPLPKANPHDRDPWSERGIGDLTPQHHDIIEAALEGRSFVIRGQQASNNTLMCALLAEAAAKGRTTLHVAGGRSRLARMQANLNAAGVGQIVARIDGSPEDTERLRECLRIACDEQMPPAHGDADVDALRTELRQARHTLTTYTQQLHAPFRQFGVSAMDALQVLTDITSRKPAPRTKIRLREDVLLSIAKDQGEQARDILHRGAELGMFARATAHSAWTGAVINAPEQVDVVVGALSRLATDTLPELRNTATRMAADGQLTPAHSVRHWQAQLSMLQGIREALDVFKPEIFERSAADMVIASAPSQWRKERGIAMRRSQRSRLIKHAKDMLVPGRHVTDLHRELVLVQEKREVWRSFSNADGWPVLPRGLAEAVHVTTAVTRDLDLLVPALATGFPDVYDMPLSELQRLLDRLAADPQGAELLPLRVSLLKEAAAAGIDQLLTDLRARHVETDMIDAELDLAWWASVLGLILASDEAFRGMDPLRLTDLLQRSRELDAAQVATLVPQALENIQRRRQHAIAARPEQYAQIQAFIGDAHAEATTLYSHVALTRLLAPVVLTLPTIVPLLVPASQSVDLLILDDVSALPIAELIALIARARQVIVVAHNDTHGSDSALAQVLPLVDVAPRPSRLNDQVARLLSFYGMPHVGVPRPWALRTEPVSAVWVEATGMPSPGATTIESTAAEVDAVIDVIIDHLLSRPDESLAVIALNTPHADRIREAVARAIAQEPSLGSHFDPSRVEPFVVADPSQVGGLRRDHIIIAVGFAKTPHGRVLHDFGVLSSPEGASAMAAVLSCAREDLTLVSAIRPSEIDRDRLSSLGAHMLVDMLATAEGQVPIAPGSWPVIEREPDRLLIDLAERLYSMGLEVIANLGVDGGVRVPLAIGHPAVPDRMLVAVLTDDAEYMNEPSLRIRDRLIPQMLHDQGWQVFTAMSLAVFIDPASVAQQIVDVVLDEVDYLTAPAEPIEEPTPTIITPAELAPEEQAALDATNDARARHDEALTGMIHIITQEDSREQDAHSAVHDDAPGGVHGSIGTTNDNADPLLSTAPHEGADTSSANSGTTTTATNTPNTGQARNAGSGRFADALAQWNDTVGEVGSGASPRGPRPPIARGLPLSAYGDDQLDELAVWVRSDGIERTHEELVEELRMALRITRRGTQTDAVLSHVIRRTEPHKPSAPEEN